MSQTFRECWFSTGPVPGRHTALRYSGPMRVFISSAVHGLESFRDAVERAAKVLGHEVALPLR